MSTRKQHKSHDPKPEQSAPDPQLADGEVPTGDLLDQVLANTMQTRRPMRTSELVAQRELIVDIMRQVMVKDSHYGVIPGTGGDNKQPKPVLLQSGAQLLLSVFRLDAQPSITEEWRDDHLLVTATTTIYRMDDGKRVGAGMARCSTLEKKYRWRVAKRECPKCGAPTINESKDKPEFYCWKKIGGCGLVFPNTEPSITRQVTGLVENPDIADFYNTVVKIGLKRSLVAATLNVTAASDIFTQDLEDMPDGGHGATTAAPAAATTGTQQPQQEPVKPANGNGGGITPAAALVWFKDMLAKCKTVKALTDWAAQLKPTFTEIAALKKDENVYQQSLQMFNARKAELTGDQAPIKNGGDRDSMSPTAYGPALAGDIVDIKAASTVAWLGEVAPKLRETWKSNKIALEQIEAEITKARTILSGDGEIPWK